MKGCLLPHFDLNLSDQAPINGSETASTTSAMPRAKEAKIGFKPKTWL